MLSWWSWCILTVVNVLLIHNFYKKCKPSVAKAFEWLNQKQQILRYVSYDMIKSYSYMKVREYITKKMEIGCIHSDRERIYVAFWYNNKKYNLMLKRRRGVPEDYTIFSMDEQLTTPINVTKSVEKYLGPYNNFFGIPVTPKDFGFKVLEFRTDDTAVIFNENDPIVLE